MMQSTDFSMACSDYIINTTLINVINPYAHDINYFKRKL